MGKQASTRLLVSQLSTTAAQRIALYARVSTSAGHQDPEMQLRELREYIFWLNCLRIGARNITAIAWEALYDNRPYVSRSMRAQAGR